MKPVISESADQSSKFLGVLSQAQIDAIASAAPKSDVKNGRWGKSSHWAVSRAAKLVRSGERTAEQVLSFLKEISLDILAFETYQKELGGNIDRYASFSDLHTAAKPYIEGGEVKPRTVTSRMSNRARTAYQKMKAPGMTKVYEDGKWLVSSPDGIDANRTMSPVGRWCHTGAAGMNGEVYWEEYAGYGPLYYILNKEDGFVLCHSYARQYEIRNQADIQPERLPDSAGWRVDVQKVSDETRDPALRYRNDERSWEDFFAWIDPSGRLAGAIRGFEKRYDEIQAKRMAAAFEKEIAGPVLAAVKDGVLELTPETAKPLERLLKADEEDVPEEDGWDPDSDGDYDEAVAQAEARNERLYAEYRRFVLPGAAGVMHGIRVIRPKIADMRGVGVFRGMTYAGALPAFDLSDVERADRMFAYSRFMKKAPEITGAGKVKSAYGMFMGCTVLEEVGVLSLPEALNVSAMFKDCTALKEVAALDAPAAPAFADVFPRKAKVKIGRLSARSARDALSAFKSEKHAPLMIEVADLDLGDPQDFYERTTARGGAYGNGTFAYEAAGMAEAASASQLTAKMLELLKKPLFSTFEFRGPYAVIDGPGFNRLITAYPDDIEGYYVPEGAAVEIDQLCALASAGQKVVVPERRVLSMGHSQLRRIKDRCGNLYLEKAGGGVAPADPAAIEKALFDREHPDGMTVVRTFDDAERFRKAAYTPGGALKAEYASVDITGMTDPSGGRPDEALVFFLRRGVPSDASELPEIKLTDRQKRHRDGRWVWYQDDRDWESDDLLVSAGYDPHGDESRLDALAARYGADLQRYGGFIAVPTGENALRESEWRRILGKIA